MKYKHPKVKERREFGKSLRTQTPRSSHAHWTASGRESDPVVLIEQQNEDRLDWLVPVRRARMMASPFAFYRGAARIMATHLSTTPTTGLMVQACGDAHLANFGFFASPERKLVFDLNDFDETLPGPWEWDVKRLAASFVIAARHNEMDSVLSREAAQLVGQSYREAMREFSEMRALDIWYSLIDETSFLSYTERERSEQKARKIIAKSKTKESRQAMVRLTEESDGEYRIKSEPPLLVPLRELQHTLHVLDEDLILKAYDAYKSELAPDRRALLEKYTPIDFAIKVVGVGSVGTRCFVLLLEGRDRDDPLFLQIKQANRSVLEEHLQPSSYDNRGRRVVEGQRLMQTVSDIFLGWTNIPETGNDYYWRQLRDWKGSVSVEKLDIVDLNTYARLCAWTLARAHARSGDPVAIAGYLGSGDTFDRALADFAASYAQQNELDYEQYLAAVRDRNLQAHEW